MYCQTQIALLSQSENDIVLGGAFYTAFVGIFDTENSRIGFAESVRALPGSSIQCIGDDCPTTNPITPEEPTDDKTSNTNALIALILLISLIVIILICLGVYLYWKKESRGSGSSRIKKGKKAPIMDDYIDDDSEEDPNTSLTQI